MKAAFIDSKYTDVSKLAEYIRQDMLQKQYAFEYMVFPMSGDPLTNAVVREQGIDLLVTFGLTGFERGTLMGGGL